MAYAVFGFIIHIFLISSALCQTQKPNILFILADDYGYNDIGYHGADIRTPNLNKLADGGVILENYYVQPLSTPTRSQLMSGRYQIHTGLQHGDITNAQPNGLPLNSPTLADKLKEAGYSTHAVGKWHLGFYKKDFMPMNRGFDTHYGFLTGSEDHYNHEDVPWFQRENLTLCGTDFRDGFQPVNSTTTYSTELYRDRVVEIISKHDTAKPLFLYLALQAVHTPLQVPKKYLESVSYLYGPRKIYAGMVVAMDQAIGEIVSAFQVKGIWNNTLLIFSTDNGGLVKHGGGSNWPLRGFKGSLWEGGIRGVAFAHGDVLGRSQVVSRDLMHVSDWYPTLVGLAGGSLNGTQPLDGIDQWKMLSGGSASAREILLHNIDPLTGPIGERMYNDTFDTRVRAALRWRQWKVLTGNPGNGSWVPGDCSGLETKRGSGGEPTKNLWLFDLSKDPNEMDDLSDVYPDITRKLLGMLEAANRTAVPCSFPDPDPDSNPTNFDGFWGPWLL
ncbi:LOW QUALITY PROTEIN: arylsulfatase B-like [Pecten maximus]|uniref:LOW QUALITY PROTEIN: arylsulfatase B-like n=1 Tax=Pecten maximus TaxID=6579 RepID=UPI0014583700|nr:LOW QUALITY PROTEIN: arylsulfatase B-like [Pecten maximus]